MMNRRPIALGLAATLALAGFSACSAPGNTPVAVSDPVSTAASTSADPVSAALDACDYAYHDYTEEFVAEHPDPVQLNNGLDGAPDYYKSYVQPDEACMDVQQAVNTAARWMEAASGIPLAEYQFTTYAFRRTDYQNGERTIWSVGLLAGPGRHRRGQLPLHHPAGCHQRPAAFAECEASPEQRAVRLRFLRFAGAVSGHAARPV